MQDCILPEDMLFEISERIPDGKTWKSLVRCCKSAYKFNTIKNIEKYANRLTYILLERPDILNSKIKEISPNPSLSFDFVLAHPELMWDWWGLSSNPSLPFDFVLTHPELNWSWYHLSSNPHLSIDFVLSHPEIDWSWENIFYNNNKRL